MPKINSIELNLQTGNLSGAGTDGYVWLGVCGREFYIDTTRDDFERGSSRTYVFGDGSNVNNAAVNDPRAQLLFVENVDDFPVYIRFQPQGTSDNWQVQRATLSFNGAPFPQWDTSSFIGNDPATGGIWLGTRSGFFVHIPRHQDPGVK